MSEKPLAGKVALVTGAGRGIGRAIALGFAQAGAAVCCTARTVDEIEATAESIVAAGARAIAVPSDVSDPVSAQRLVAKLESALGCLDILVLNAGVNPDRKPVAESDPKAWRTTIEVNLIGPYLCAQAAIPLLRRSGSGKIITIGSGIGHRAGPATSAYACSKAGLWMLTRVLAQELAADRISVNELIPGPVETAMLRSDPAHRAFMGQTEWLKGPADVVPLALFLATLPAVGPSGQSFSLMRRDK